MFHKALLAEHLNIRLTSYTAIHVHEEDSSVFFSPLVQNKMSVDTAMDHSEFTQITRSASPPSGGHGIHSKYCRHRKSKLGRRHLS